MHHWFILFHSSCPPHPLSTPDSHSSLALHTSDSSISQCISLLWQKSVQDLIWSGRKLTHRWVWECQRQHSNQCEWEEGASWNLERGKDLPLWFLLLVCSSSWNGIPKQTDYGKNVVFLTTLKVCMVKLLFLSASFFRKIGIFPLHTKLISYLIAVF